MTATTDADGMATADLTGLTTVGTGTLTATATVGGATASADFVIRGGAPSNLALQLQATVGGTAVGPGTDLQIPAGTPVSATVTITDGSQNTLNLPFTLIPQPTPPAPSSRGTPSPASPRPGAGRSSPWSRAPL